MRQWSVSVARRRGGPATDTGPGRPRWGRDGDGDGNGFGSEGVPVVTTSETGTGPRLGQVAPLEPGDPRAVGGYPLLGRLGVGGMGTVYLGRGRGAAGGVTGAMAGGAAGGMAGGAAGLVAVKVIHPDLARDQGFRGRVSDEVAAARRVSPFCTARVLDADPTAPQPYLVTEFVDGVTLGRAVSDRGALDESTVHGVALGVASALVAIHRAGVVHRDLKPGNVLLSLSGPRVIDFGIARALDASMHRTAVGVVLGTPGWMAPEQLCGGQVGPPADVFSWGSLIGYAATGRSPWGNDGPPAALAHRIIDGEPDLAGLGGPLRSLVVAALRKDPARRPAARELVQALLGGQGGMVGGGPVTNPTAAATSLLERTWTGLPGWPGAAGMAGAAGTAGAASGRTAVGPPLSHTLQPRPGGAAYQPAAYQPASGQARRDLPGGTAGSGRVAAPSKRASGPGAAPRRRRWYRKKRYTVLLLVALAVLLVNSATEHGLSWWRARLAAAGSQSQSQPPPSSAPDRRGPAPSPAASPASGSGSGSDGAGRDAGTSTVAGIGDAVRDGQFTFVVESFRCGVRKIGSSVFARHPSGQYCLAQLQVRNTGSQSRLLAGESQKLADTSGNSHDPDTAGMLVYGSNLWVTPLDPGQQARGTLVFDIPKDTEPASLVLHDSAFSDGARVTVTG